MLKRYRVWQANRKQFLYPENYIEPELRDEKTPQFEPEPELNRPAREDRRRVGERQSPVSYLNEIESRTR